MNRRPRALVYPLHYDALTWYPRGEAGGGLFVGISPQARFYEQISSGNSAKVS